MRSATLRRVRRPLRLLGMLAGMVLLRPRVLGMLAGMWLLAGMVLLRLRTGRGALLLWWPGPLLTSLGVLAGLVLGLLARLRVLGVLSGLRLLAGAGAR